MDKKRLRAVVLGAGKGKRLASEEAGIPKVMRQAGGKPLLGYVLKALGFIDKKDIIIVVGYKREFIQSAFPGYNYAVQEKQLGTGHAVMAAGGQLEGFEGDVLICYGDMPLVRTKTYEQLIDYHRREKSACTILSGISDEKMLLSLFGEGVDCIVFMQDFAVTEIMNVKGIDTALNSVFYENVYNRRRE